jgi:hypothetical protein
MGRQINDGEVAAIVHVAVDVDVVWQGAAVLNEGFAKRQLGFKSIRDEEPKEAKVEVHDFLLVRSFALVKTAR